MKYAPTILGAVLFFIGFCIALSIDFPQDSPTNFLGLSIQDASEYPRAVKAALMLGASFTLMICGAIVPLVLQWEYSKSGADSRKETTV